MGNSTVGAVSEGFECPSDKFGVCISAFFLNIL